MAELDIGKHCSTPECHQLDFLPFLCDGCGNVFCKEHCVKSQHNCSCHLLPSTDRPSAPYKTYSCQFHACKQTELVPVPCNDCHKNFCMQHRHSVDHNCTAVTVKPLSMSATSEHVQKILDSKAEPVKPIGKAKSQKSQEMAAKVNLMKIKLKAKGDDGLPPESRVYLTVSLPCDKPPSADSLFYTFLDKKWTVGRCIDAVSDRVKLRNDNNRAGAKKLRLCSPNVGMPYSLDDTLESLLDCRSIYNGSIVGLCYVSD